MKTDGNGLVTGKHAGFASAPRSVVCVGCNGQYFAASLPIHQRSCFERNAFVSVACPKCSTAVRTGTYHAHVGSCAGESGACNDGDGTSRVALPRHNDRNNPSELNPPEADGRIRCKCCDRAFHQDRIAKHQSVCVGPPPSRSSDRSRTIQPNQTGPRRPRSTVPASSIRSLTGTCRAASTPSNLRARPSLRLVENRPAQRPTGCFTRQVEARHFDMVTRDSGRQGLLGGSSSSGYPGASRMQTGRWGGTSNASSTGNPLVMNRMMTASSVGHSF